MSSTLITSQDYLNDGIVAAKIMAGDYAVTLSPEFVVDGAAYRVVLDGHHSLAAARQMGVEPDWTTATPSTHDAVSLLVAGDADGFLHAVHMGSDYRDVDTGVCVW